MEEKYQMLKMIADEIESIRLFLFTNQEHRENLDDAKDFEFCDDTLFRLQSEVRNLVILLRGEY